jgi:hypothetical protein
MSDHPRGRVAGWILLALAGLAVAVALSVTASDLSTQPIGLTGEPLRAGDRLAPTDVTRTQATIKPAKPAPAQTQTTPLTATSGRGPGDNDSDDHGRGRHRDSDDD